MQRIGVAEWCLKKRGLSALQYAGTFGVRVVHLGISSEEQIEDLFSMSWPGKLVDASRGVAAETGCLALNCVERIGLLKSSSPKALRRCREIARRSVDVAQSANIPMIYVPSFGACEIADERDLEDTAEFLRDLCAHAADTDVVVASENALSGSDNARLIGMVPHPNFRVLFDAYNPVRWGHRPVDVLEAVACSIADQVHVKDGLSGGYGNADLGHGDGNLVETVAALRRLLPHGTFVLENDYTCDESMLIRDCTWLSSTFVSDRSMPA